MRVAVAQINTTVGDLAGNTKKILQGFSFARRTGARLLLFPEMTLPGYPPEDLLFKRAFIDANLRYLKRLASRSRGNFCAIVGFVDRDREGRLYNASAVLANGRWRGTYRKIELPNYGVFDEKRYFSAGKQGCLLEIDGFKIGLSICEDIWLPQSFVYDRPYRGGTSLIINTSASPYHIGKQGSRRTLIKNLAKRTRAAAVYVNLVGGQDELVFDGGSLAVSPAGRILREGAYLDEDHFAVDIPLSQPRPLGHGRQTENGPFQTLPVALGRRPSSAKGLPRQKKRSVRTPSKESEVYHALVLGTRDYVEKNGFKKVLIGLSGGIDSALVAAIAVDALGPDRVIGVTMPSRHTSKGTYSDAKELARKLRMGFLEIPIEPAYDAFLKTLAPIFSGLKIGLAEENLQARIRGNLLMALSNKFGHLVLTTGNKSEMATGYCTLYGDMAGGFAVIKDVPKTLVYRLSRFRNGQGHDHPISESVLRRPPTAELREGQKDSDSLPPYPQLDPLLKAYIEDDRSPEDLVRRGSSRGLVRGVIQKVDRNEYKRRQAPPGIKITPKAFGRDRRMPITNKFIL